MSKKRHTRDARIRAIREHESGRSQAGICRQLNITAPTFYSWKKQLEMMTNPDVRRLRKRILKIVVEKTLSPRVLREQLPEVLAMH